MNIHENAKSSYNEKAKSSLGKVVNIPYGERKPINLQLFNSGTISSKDIIGEVVIHYQDDDGLCGGFSFINNGANVGLIGPEYIEIQKMIESIVRNKGIKEVCSYKYVEDKFEKWFIDSIKKNETREFIEYLDQASVDDIKEYSIWIPIPFTTIEHDFAFGNMEFRILSERTIDEWFSREEVHMEIADKHDDYILRIKKEYQGYAFGVVKTVAVKERAKEIAYEKISDALSFIRIFVPANRNISKKSGLYEYGWKMNESEDYFVVNEKGECNGLAQAIRDTSLMGHMSSDFIAMIVKSEFNGLLCKEERTEFEQEIFNSILIYSKNTLKNDTFDRLLYILSALEMILLKNDTEPIQQNLSDRMAYACADTVDERMKIVDLVKKIYGIRSKYVHHGQFENIDKNLINRFLNLSWIMFNNIVSNMHIAEKRLDFIEQLELIKYS
jgi:hypothetical protein